jgi:hypothetical protein
LEQGGDLFQDSVHAHGGVDGGIYFVMVSARVHHQDLGSGVRFFDHVGEMMAIVLGQGSAQDYQVESIAAQGLLDGLAALGRGDVMPGFLHGRTLGGECGFVGLAVENFDGGFLSDSGQRALLVNSLEA